MKPSFAQRNAHYDYASHLKYIDSAHDDGDDDIVHLSQGGVWESPLWFMTVDNCKHQSPSSQLGLGGP